jgi:NAD+ kinase
MASKCELVAGSSLIVVLGGDGTTLAAAREAAPFDVPLFGVNLGRVGFLSEATPEAWQSKLERVLGGDYWLERRLMLKGEVRRDDVHISDLSALNDIVVSRGEHVRVVRFHLFVDGDHVTTYTADGLIVSTPTGSTAYSMAAGGPLLPPQLKNFLIIPVAPHLSFERPVVLHQEAVVKIRVEMIHRALATADGQDAVHLQSGDEVLISKHQNESLFARVDGQSYFYHRLMQRLSFWSRKQ